MNKISIYTFLLVLTGWINQFPSSFAQDPGVLKIDPLLMISLKECRHITQTLGDDLFHGWDFKSTPILFYRPNVQELLINYPHQPKGFSLYHGFNPLHDKNIYVRTGLTTIAYDDQNTSIEIDSIPVLVVADPFSTMRNRLKDAIGRPGNFTDQWLTSWQFIPDPYFELEVILHEAFHVYQNRMAPDKYADESVVSQYPLLEPENNALYAVEGNILRDALLSPKSEKKTELIKKFIAVRTYRQSRLDSNWVEYENLNEYQEGLAKYVEYKFMQLGEAIEPVKEMYYHQGFSGYRGVLSKKFQLAMDNMVNIVAVNDDRFGNKFGSGPLRFRLYDLGACEALLLDELMPQWKDRIFRPNEYLANMLKQSFMLSADDLKRYLNEAKNEYRYDTIYQSKLVFEKEGMKKIEEKVASILRTEKTLVKISYGNLTQNVRIGRYTPFGITQITKQSAIYELVPVLVWFKKGVVLDFKQAIPVIVDQENKQIIFSVDSPPAKFLADFKSKMDQVEFSLTSPTEVSCKENVVSIQLK